MLASISKNVSSAVAEPVPPPSHTVMPRALQASKSRWALILPVCEISFKFGKRASKAAQMRVRSRINTRASAASKRCTNWSMSLTVSL